MDAIDVGLVAVGLFYVFAGIVAARAALVSRLLDVALGQISLKPIPRDETLQTAWHLIAANVILAGGAALVLRLDIATWLFLASLALQAIYLTVVAPYYFDRSEPADPTGRRQTVNAFVIYGLATLFVMWAWRQGRLLAIGDIGAPMLMAAAILVGAHAGQNLLRMRSGIGGRKSSFDLGGLDDDLTPSAPSTPITRVTVMADYYRFPTWSMDAEGDGSDFPPEDLGLSPELCHDLNDWAEAYLGSRDPDEADKSAWSTEQRADHERQGRRLAERIATERPDLEVHVFTYSLGIVPLVDGKTG